MSKTRNNIHKITITALSIALVCVGTTVIQIPIPLGYMHLGNIFILLIAGLFSPTTALLAGGVGSAMADFLTGYPQWILPTLIIKSLMGYAACMIFHQKGQDLSILSFRTLLGSISSILIMVLGYFIGGSILYGSIYTGATQILGLTIEGFFGISGFYILGLGLEKAHVYQLIHRI